MNANEAIAIIKHVACGDMEFSIVDEWSGGPLFLQVEAPRLDAPAFLPGMSMPAIPGTPAPLVTVKGRKWRLSEHMTASELVQTAFAAALHFEEHELREIFLYRGQSVFGPHFDVDDLVALAAVRGKAGARP